LGSSWVQRTPAGLPPGMPGRLALAGMAELMEGAMQHAPQPGRQCKLPAAAVRDGRRVEAEVTHTA